MANSFSAGDVVQLKSGGPRMTILWIDDNGNATCSWFDKSGKALEQVFPLASLQIPLEPSIGIA